MAFVPYRDVRRNGRNSTIKTRSNQSIPNLTRHMTGGLKALIDRLRTKQKLLQQVIDQNPNIQNPLSIQSVNQAIAQCQKQTSTVFNPADVRPLLSEQPAPAPAQLELTNNNQSTNQATKSEWTRPDGHLSISSSLPLLNRRYRVLQTVGEGTFSQLVLAEDTFTQLPSTPSNQSNNQSNNPNVNLPETPSQGSTNQLKSLSLGNNAQSDSQSASHSTSSPASNYKRVAIKIMNSKYSFIGVQEVDKLCWLNGRDQRNESHIVRLIGAFYFDGHLCLVLELLGPSLLSLIKSGVSSQSTNNLNNSRHRVPLDSIGKICWQLCLALSFVASCSMIHGDVKPENVLLTSTQPGSRSVNVKLIDFGNAMTGAESLLYFDDFDVQTLYYRAPEVLLGVGFGPPIDMWSLGCVAVELATGRPLFHCANNTELFDAMISTLGPMPSQPFKQGKFATKFFTQPHYTYPTSMSSQSSNPSFMSSMGQGVSAPNYDTHSHARMNTLATLLGTRDRDFVSFICGLLEYDPSQRLTATSALFHPFFGRLTPMSMLFGDASNVRQASMRQSANNTKPSTNPPTNQPNMNGAERYLVPIQSQQQVINQSINQPSIFSSMRGAPVIYSSPHLQPVTFNPTIQPISQSMFAPLNQSMSQPLTQSFINQSLNQSMNPSMLNLQSSPQTFAMNDRRVLLQQLVAPMQPVLITQSHPAMNQSINQSMNPAMETYYPTALNTFYTGPIATPLITARPPPANPKLVPPSPDFSYNNITLASPILHNQSINQSINQPMNQMNQSINHSMTQPMNPFSSPAFSHTLAAQQQHLVDSSMIDMQSINQTLNPSFNPRKLSINTSTPSNNQMITQAMLQQINQQLNQPINGFNQPIQYISSPPLTSQTLNQQINQSINHLTNQSINQFTNQSMSQLTNQSITHLPNQSTNQSINQPINQSINQPINQSVLQSNPEDDSPMNRIIAQRKRKIEPPAVACSSTGGLKRRLNSEEELPPRASQSQRQSPR